MMYLKTKRCFEALEKQPTAVHCEGLVHVQHVLVYEYIQRL